MRVKPITLVLLLCMNLSVYSFSLKKISQLVKFDDILPNLKHIAAATCIVGSMSFSSVKVNAADSSVYFGVGIFHESKFTNVCVTSFALDHSM